MKLTLFSRIGTTIAYCSWIAAMVFMAILGDEGVGPGVWIMHLQADSFGFVSKRLTFVALAFIAAPVWFFSGAFFDLMTKQGLFEPDPEELRRKERLEDREWARKRTKRRRRDSVEEDRDEY